MKHALLNLLGSPLIPELGSNITAGTTGHIHLILVCVAAVGTLPDELAVLVLLNLNLPVIAAHLAVVALGIQLRIHNIVIDKAHDRENSLQVILHIGNLHIGNGSAGRKCLELGLQGQLVKSVNIFRYMDMIAVGNIALVRDILYDAEALLKAFCKFVGSALQRCAIERVVDLLRSLPLGCVFIELSHNLKAQSLTIRLRELFAVQTVNTFPQSGIAQGQGGISVVKIFVNGLALF